MIRFDNVRVTFGATVALDAVDLALSPGVTGLFGPNGSGKSTLLRVAAGLLRPTRGRVVVDIEGSDEDVRRVIGYAGHRSGLYGRLTITENLDLTARLHGAPRERVDALLAGLELTPYAHRAAGDLSAGLLRRAAVARALTPDPRLLLLDEPYANLDDEAAELVTASVKSWWRPDRCALIATHGAKRLKGYADASVVLRRGRLASHRTRAEVTGA